MRRRLGLTFSCALLLAAMLGAPQIGRSASRSAIRFSDVRPLLGHLGGQIARDPLHAAEVADATAKPFWAARGSAGAILRAEALSMGIALPHPAGPPTQDLTEAISQAYSFAGRHVDARDRARLVRDSAPLSPIVRSSLADIVAATTASIVDRADAFARLTPAELGSITDSLTRLRPLDASKHSATFVAGTTKAALSAFASRHAVLDKIDVSSLLRGNVLIADAIDRARAGLAGLQTARTDGTPPVVRVPTPYGDIVVKGTGNDVNDENNFILLDQGGNDSYTGQTAGASGDPVTLVNYLAGGDAPPPGVLVGATQTRIALDLGGADTYTGNAKTQGFGESAGLGILVDDGQDVDKYSAGKFAEGSGYLAGLGILIDGGGNNSFTAGFGTQGFSEAAGLGVLASGNGNDSYSALVLSQGTGFDGGAGGTLLDQGGNDDYRCTGEIDAADVVLPVAESRPTTGCHGAGFGGQALLVDGGGDDHYFVKTSFQVMALIGVGVLVDLGGTDFFDAGEWSQGIAALGVAVLSEGAGKTTYFSDERTPHSTAWTDVYIGSNGEGYTGVGVLSDRGGADTYTSTVDKTRFMPQFACGSGCAYADGLGLLQESEGNDAYSTEIGEGGSLGGFAALFEQAGNDMYALNTHSTRGQGFGGAIPGGDFNCGVGYLVDESGADTYSNPVTTFGTRGDDRRWEQGDYGRGVDGTPGLTAYLTEKAADDLHTYVSRYACENVFPPPFPIP